MRPSMIARIAAALIGLTVLLGIAAGEYIVRDANVDRERTAP